jgi:hypothetical protein
MELEKEMKSKEWNENKTLNDMKHFVTFEKK